MKGSQQFIEKVKDCKARRRHFYRSNGMRGSGGKEIRIYYLQCKRHVDLLPEREYIFSRFPFHLKEK